MRSLILAIFTLLITVSAPSCSRKSGCPADSAQTQVDKNGEYKPSKTTSGLLPSKAYKKKK